MGQQIVIYTRLDIDVRESYHCQLIRRVARLTIEISWCVDCATAHSRTRVYEFNSDLAETNIDYIKCGLKSGEFLREDHHDVHSHPHFDPHAPYELVVHDTAQVREWFGEDFVDVDPQKQKQITDGKKALPANTSQGDAPTEI